MSIVYPIVPRSEQQPFESRFKVTPQERFDFGYWNKSLPGIRQTPISACRSIESSQIFTTIDTRTVFVVKELIYPGDVAVEIENKWIYAFHIGGAARCLAEIYAESLDQWRYRLNPTFSSNFNEQLPQISRGQIELPIKPDEPASNFAFFISPVRLTAQGAEILLESREKLSAATVRAIRENQQTILAVVPDAFHWAIEAHEQYYVPALDNWLGYVLEPELQAKVFIAGTLKAWIEQDDNALGVKNELHSGEPNRFLDSYKREEETCRVKAEEAAAYLGYCFDADEHRAVERSAIQIGEQALSAAFQRWGVVSERLIETAQGRKFAAQLCADSTRLPKQYLFPETPDAGLMDYFPNFRYAWLAAVATYAELVPAYIAQFPAPKSYNYENPKAKLNNEPVIPKMEKLRQQHTATKQYLERQVDPGILNNIKKHFETLGIRAKSHQLDEQVFENIQKGREVGYGIKYRNFKRYFEKLIEETDSAKHRLGTDAAIALPGPSLEKKLSRPVKIEDIVNSNDTPHIDAISHFKKARYLTGMIIEIVNVSLALSSFLDADAETRYERTWSLVGAGADAASVFADFFKEARLGFGTRGWGALGGAAGFIGGVCQMVDEERQLVDGLSKNDYGISAGRSVAALGGGMILAEAISGGAIFSGPIGAIVAGIGAVLIIGGNLIATGLSKNQYEHFAKACFLGDSHNDETVYHDWALGGLPTKNVLQEAIILVALLASFRMEKVGHVAQLEQEGFLDPHADVMCLDSKAHLYHGYVKIYPGYLTSDAKLSIKLKQLYDFNWKLTGKTDSWHTFEAYLLVEQISQQILFLHGTMQPELNLCKITRGKNNNIESILICLKPAWVKGEIVANRPGQINFDELSRGSLETQALPSVCQISARVEMSNHSIASPIGVDWVQLDTAKDETVTSLDSSKWIH